MATTKTKKKGVTVKKVPKKRKSRKGIKNKKTEERQKTLLEYARQGGGLSPAEFMIAVMNGEQPVKGHTFTAQDRYNAAKDVAPYCHSKLRTTEVKAEIIPATFNIFDA